MINKSFFLLVIIALSFGLYSCGGGGGSGSADVPPGENPGGATVVQLLPASFVAQTNAYIALYAKVLDGNGHPVPNVDVTFTNLSTVGSLDKTSAKTDGQGLARVNLSSSSPGFATILAQINTSAGVVRDRRTVFFSSLDVLSVSMDMDVDSVPGNGVFNENDDFILFQNASDDTFKVRATVYNAGGVPVAGESVEWSASHSEVTSVRTDPYTNTNGQAEGVFKVQPSSIRNTETTINIMAYAGNGAANMVTLFLRPVTVSSSLSSVTANPDVVDLGGSSTITANVMLNTGSPAPDGTTVNFTATCGTVTPFAQTTGGVAKATFTAPKEETTCTVSAKVGGSTVGSTSITVRPANLLITPGTLTVCTAGKYTFTIRGGTPPYTTVSDTPSKACNSSDDDCVDTTDTGSWSGSSITVTIPATATPGDVKLTAYDSNGKTATATIAIKTVKITPISVSICENDSTCPAGTDTANFTISGGTGPYHTYSSNNAVIPDPGAGSSFTVNANNNSITTDTTVTLTVVDDGGGCGAQATVTVINQ